MNDIEIIDDSLDLEYFLHLKRSILGVTFPWSYQPEVANVGEENDHFYFVHRLYERYTPVSSFMNELDEFLVKTLKAKSLIRSRVLLYPNQGKFIHHEPHVDFPYSHKAALLYINDNNGFTEFETGESVESISNRLIIFDGSRRHNSTTCTDQSIRVVLAVNYF